MSPSATCPYNKFRTINRLLRHHTITTLSGGFTNSKENRYWLANELARQNIIVFAIRASDNMSVEGYTNAHTGTVKKIKEENSRPAPSVTAESRISNGRFVGT